ncbi:hypothetical protein ACFFMN_41145 [Planobispora siamensis]|nr:hypothetical protein [Planobispora siamensis]
MTLLGGGLVATAPAGPEPGGRDRPIPTPTASAPSVFVTRDERGRPGGRGPDSPLYRWFRP